MHGFPTTLITVGPSTPDICNAPEIARYFALALATLGAVGSIICMFVLPPIAAAPHEHQHFSDCWVWHVQSLFITLWEEAGYPHRTYRWNDEQLHDNRVTTYAILAL